jgi:short subunit dehydrogenase-like uncharacterized protein
MPEALRRLLPSEEQRLTRAIVLGGYGTFGSHVARELARLGTTVVVAGRDLARAEAFAHLLGPLHRGTAVDVTRPESCYAALEGCTVAVNCAGPFGAFDATVLEACLRANCHYADISDDRAYVALVRARGDLIRQRRLAAVWGCSSLPAISSALGLTCRQGAPARPERARVTLFIGNRNPGGKASIRSFVGILGKRITAPQGQLRGFRDREVVPLPPPFGPRAVFNMDSPEYDLFPQLLGVQAVSVKVGFELRLVTYGFALLARLGSRYGARTVRLLSGPARLLRRFGCTGAAVMTELFFPDGSTRRAALVAPHDSQRMASLPCAFVARALAQGGVKERGALTACEFLGADRLLQQLVAEGFELHATL